MGLAATGGVGDSDLVTEQNVPLTGLQGQGFVGTPTVVQGGGVDVTVSGLSATASIGSGASIILGSMFHRQVLQLQVALVLLQLVRVLVLMLHNRSCGYRWCYRANYCRKCTKYSGLRSCRNCICGGHYGINITSCTSPIR